VTLAAARVPLVFFFSGLLSRLLPTFLRAAGASEPAGLARTATLIAVGTVAVALVGALLAFALGGQVIEVLFGPEFAPEPWVAAGVTGGVLLATGSTVVSQVLVAQGSEARALAAWSVALAAAATAIAIRGGSDTERVVIGFVIGEAVALATLTVFTRRHQPDQRLSGDPEPQETA
jgi:O-antigen/teichoic acid export membrane protein